MFTSEEYIRNAAIALAKEMARKYDDVYEHMSANSAEASEKASIAASGVRNYREIVLKEEAAFGAAGQKQILEEGSVLYEMARQQAGAHTLGETLDTVLRRMSEKNSYTKPPRPSEEEMGFVYDNAQALAKEYVGVFDQAYHHAMAQSDDPLYYNYARLVIAKSELNNKVADAYKTLKVSSMPYAGLVVDHAEALLDEAIETAYNPRRNGKDSLDKDFKPTQTAAQALTAMPEEGRAFLREESEKIGTDLIKKSIKHPIETAAGR